MKKSIYLLAFLIAVFFTSCKKDSSSAPTPPSYNNPIITTIAGNGSYGYTGDGGPATSARFTYAIDVAIDGSGILYIADFENFCVRKINTSGIISTFAGPGTYDSLGDGKPATEATMEPNAIAVDDSGNVYISDQENDRIRKVNTSGIISTYAGNGVQGYSGDEGPATAAELNLPDGIAVDNSGNVYIVDQWNERIRKVNTHGVISTFAGNGYTYPAPPYGGFSGDGGPATMAELNIPSSVTVDGSGNVYIADTYNQRIRKVNTSGIISTIAGNGIEGFSGNGGAATSASLDVPTSVAIDGSGNLYIGEDASNCIRVVNSSGIISTFAGSGIPPNNYGFSGDGGPAILARLCDPCGMTFDGSGNLYFADYGNNRIRKVYK